MGDARDIDQTPRTDLAAEAYQFVRDRWGGDIPGVDMEEEQVGAAHVTRTHIHSFEGERMLGKVRGHYVTIDAPNLRRRNRAVQEEVARALARELEAWLPPGDTLALVVGLGNWHATPDALGPRVVDQVLVTRHLRAQVPQELLGSLRPVCALAPGVLGLTGIETGEIVAAVVERVRPAVVVVVDALAARNLERLATTIQVADTGIHPGSGVGNTRAGITPAALGVPVIAIGVPTVVHATTIAADTVEALSDRLAADYRFYDILRQLGQDRRGLVEEVLGNGFGDLVVTPKEIDVLIRDTARLLGGALNTALHPGIPAEQLARYLDA